MTKILLLYFLFINFLFGYEQVDISKIESHKNIKKYLHCQVDSDETLGFEDVLHNKNLQAIKKTNLGYLQQTYWCRFDAINNSNEESSIIFVNPRPGMDYIDVKIYKDDNVTSFTLGDMVSPKNRSYASVFSNFELNLKAKQSASVVVKYKSVGNLEVSWIAHTFKNFLSNENMNFILIFTMFGFFFAIMIYKFFIYFHIRDIAYLIYAFSIGSIIISQASLQGTMHYFLYDYIDPFTITLFCWNSTHLFLALLWIFVFCFFNITKQSRFYYPMLIVIVYNILIILFYTSAYIWVQVLMFTPLIAGIAFLESFLLLFFSLAMFFQKKAGSGYFLIGHFLYILSVFTYILNLQGAVEFSLLNQHSTAIGLFFAIFFMSLALSAKFKAIKEENTKQKELIDKNRQYTMIGTTIAYVSHQWKQPLSILSSQVNLFLATIDHKPKTHIIDMKEKVASLEDSIMSLNTTLDTIKKLFTSENNSTQTISMRDAIDTILSTYKQKISLKNVSVELHIDTSLTIQGNQNLFIHAISNIIDNALDAFDDLQKEKRITIAAHKKATKKLSLSIVDNAGGIKLTPLDNIFNPHITGKTFGSGIGLAFTKNIIESKFYGTIQASNTLNGAKFSICIKEV